MERPVLWIHAEALGPANPALQAHPGQPALFVFEPGLLAGDAGPISLQRIVFLYECLLELPVTIRQGDGAEEVLAFAARHRADGVVTSAWVDPQLGEIAAGVAASLPLQVLEPEPFVVLPQPVDLRRFSRYWKLAGPRLRPDRAETDTFS
ncbi:hypothetical protein KQ304_04730 [Synechococcus sp. CS-1329]|uniref:hypothetical protein n=1 Tax=Synechococcus sp. CS-1329 TaxID=2847975 RepID=UPI00223BB736|nr:hypothetical protein [Synechococcus sp. CS-1329]MCT0218311.1 hypothetical protein [Synechococcus sp. CS-1329]